MSKSFLTQKLKRLFGSGLFWPFSKDRRTCFWAGIILTSLIAPLPAQNELPIPPPESPLVAPMPEMMVLEVRVEEKEKSASSSSSPDGTIPAHPLGELRSVVMVKTGDIRLVKSIRSNGMSREIWIMGGMFYEKTYDGMQISCHAYNPMYPWYFQTNNTSFCGTEWITLDNYKGISSYKGKKCYYFEKEAGPSYDVIIPRPRVVGEGRGTEPSTPPKAANAPGSSKYLLKAWIDVDTKLPVAATFPEGLCRYNFGAPPQSPLNPPSEYVEYSQRMKKEAERRRREAAVR